MHPNMVVIMVPTYKPIPDRKEEISQRQSLKILHEYPMTIVGPDDMNVTCYQSVSDMFSFHFVPSGWMACLGAYRKMKQNREFYRDFLAYEYMLTDELDAVFYKDDLEYWCRAGYNYIGAP